MVFPKLLNWLLFQGEKLENDQVAIECVSCAYLWPYVQPFSRVNGQVIIDENIYNKGGDSHTVVNSRRFYQPYSKYSLPERLRMRQLSVAVILALRPPTCIIPSLERTCNLQGSVGIEELPCPSSGYTSICGLTWKCVNSNFLLRQEKTAVTLLEWVEHRTAPNHISTLECLQSLVEFCLTYRSDNANSCFYLLLFVLFLSSRCTYWCQVSLINEMYQVIFWRQSGWAKNILFTGQHLLLSHFWHKVAYACE